MWNLNLSHNWFHFFLEHTSYLPFYLSFLLLKEVSCWRICLWVYVDRRPCLCSWRCWSVLGTCTFFFSLFLTTFFKVCRDRLMHESSGRKNLKWATKDSISDEMLKEREQIVERKLLNKYATSPIVWNKMKYILRMLSKAAVVGGCFLSESPAGLSVVGCVFHTVHGDQ